MPRRDRIRTVLTLLAHYNALRHGLLGVIFLLIAPIPGIGTYIVFSSPKFGPDDVYPGLFLGILCLCLLYFGYQEIRDTTRYIRTAFIPTQDKHRSIRRRSEKQFERL